MRSARSNATGREQSDYAASRVQKKRRALPKGRGSEGVYCAAQGAMRPEGAVRLCSKPGTIKEPSAAQRQRKRRRLLRSARSNATGGSRATMQQAGYNRRAERCPKAEEARRLLRSARSNATGREQSDYTASRVQ